MRRRRLGNLQRVIGLEPVEPGQAQGSLVGAVLRGLLVLTLVVCSVIDIERRIIPNRITGPVALAALAIGDVKLLGVMGLCLGRPVLVALVLALLAYVGLLR